MSLLNDIIAAKLMGGSGGGGGGTGSDLYRVTLSEQNGSTVADKTYAEVLNAYNRGKIIAFYSGTILIGYANWNVDMGFYVNSAIYSENGARVTVVNLLSDNTVLMDEMTLPCAPAEITISGVSPTITPVANTTYKCGELTSLTISNPPATGAYSIVFTSGATATTTTIPATILGLEDFAAEANTIYEINVLDNRAVVGSWAVSA